MTTVEYVYFFHLFDDWPIRFLLLKQYVGKDYETEALRVYSLLLRCEQDTHFCQDNVEQRYFRMKGSNGKSPQLLGKSNYALCKNVTTENILYYLRGYKHICVFYILSKLWSLNLTYKHFRWAV